MHLNKVISWVLFDCTCILFTQGFVKLSVLTNIYNKKTKGHALMELFTATRKLNLFFLQLETLDVLRTMQKTGPNLFNVIFNG
jgi:hypothetical protein